MQRASACSPRRAAPAAALLLAALAPGCTHERLSTRERLSLASEAPRGGQRTVVIDEGGPRRPPVALDVVPLTRLPSDGRTLPIVSPDGRKLALVTRGQVPWAVRLGDPLPVAGLDCRIETVSLAPDAPGAPLGTLDGPWILGRGATNAGFLAERPRADAGRDLAMVAWDGTVRIVAKDEWCNAFATVAPDGAMAWSRRNPEGGDWQLVCERDGRRRVLATDDGTSWLMPVFAGDGTGLFALRLDSSAVVAAWLPFGPDRLPAEDATAHPPAVTALSLGANLGWAVRAIEPVSGLAASPPGRERLTLWLPDTGRMAIWAPGGRLEPLAARSVAATVVDPENALVTADGALLRERLITERHTTSALESVPWVVRPTTLSASELVALRFERGAVEVARMVLAAETPAPGSAGAAR